MKSTAMPRVLMSILCCLGLLAGAAQAQTEMIDLGDDPARALAGRDLPPTDPHVAQARAWLKQVAGATGESEEQVAASCVKLSRFLFDTLRIRALPIETLEGEAAQTARRKVLSDMTTAYFEARRTAPDHSHAGALARLK